MRRLPLTPEAWLAASPARLRLLSWWGLLGHMPTRRQALLSDSSGNPLWHLVRARGHECLRVASTTLIERHGAWIEPWLAADSVEGQLTPSSLQPVRLGARAGWREYRPPIFPGLPYGPPRPLRLRQETLDGLMAALPRIGMVWINDPGYLPDILSGGIESLLTRQPVLGLVLPACPGEALQDRLRRLQEGGYGLYDTAWQPLDAEGVLPRECIALPAGLDGLAGRCRSWLHELAAGATRVEAEYAEPWLASRLGCESAMARALLARGCQPCDLAELAADEWHAAETQDGRVWRWSGNGADSRLLVALPAPGSYLLRLKVLNTILPELAGRAQVFLDGWHMPEAGGQLRAGALVELPFVAEAADWTGALELRIALPFTVRPGGGDRRLLGMSVDMLEVHWRSPEWH